MAYKRLKRVLDLLISVVLLVIFLPVMLVTLCLIKIFLKGNPFFTQLRPGLNEKPFRMIKFKTMSDEKDEAGILLPDEKRLGTFGKILRKTSLDELPELWNVARGDMSLVGPRPLLMEYLPLYSSEQKRRHEVRPGITGLAQVKGRNNLPWDERFKLDVYYVSNLSFSLDLKILFLTVGKVLGAKDISENGNVTVKKFKGSGGIE